MAFQFTMEIVSIMYVYLQFIRRTPDLFESRFCSWLSPKTLDNVLLDELLVLVKSAEIGR